MQPPGGGSSCRQTQENWKPLKYLLLTHSRDRKNENISSDPTCHLLYLVQPLFSRQTNKSGLSPRQMQPKQSLAEQGQAILGWGEPGGSPAPDLEPQEQFWLKRNLPMNLERLQEISRCCFPLCGQEGNSQLI